MFKLRKKNEEAARDNLDPEVMAKTETTDPQPEAAGAGAIPAKSEGGAPDADEVPDIQTEEEEVSAEQDPGAGLMDAFEAWLQDSGQEEALSDETRRAVGRIADVMRGAEADDALFEIISRGCDYERAVESALESGEIKGRNASIDELKALTTDSDGLPHPGTGCGGDRGSRSPSIFDLARGAI